MSEGRSRWYRRILATVVTGATVTLVAGCGLALDQSSTAAPRTTSQGAPPASPFPTSSTKPAHTLPTWATTTTLDRLSRLSVDEVEEMVVLSDDELCRRVDEVVVAGIQLSNFGSTVDSRPLSLTVSQRREAYGLLREFRSEAVALLEDLLSSHLTIESATVEGIIASIGALVDRASDDVDVRDMFLSYMASDGASLQAFLLGIVGDRCPNGMLSQVNR